MKKEIVLFTFILFFSFGCLRSIEDSEGFEYESISEKVDLMLNQDCACFVCTQSTGGWWSDFFTYNDLYSGGCEINRFCNPVYRMSLTEDEKTYIRTFDIGYGSSYTEYEEANLRTNGGLGIVLRELNEYNLPKSNKYILPIYKGDANKIDTCLTCYGEGFWSSFKSFFISLLDNSKIPAFRALEKNTIPIYYINSKHVTKEWMDNFFSETKIAEANQGKISFIAVKSSAINSNQLINTINNKCTSTKNSITETRCIKYEMVETDKVDRTTGFPIYERRCTQSETRKVIETKCNSMLYVDYIVNASDVDYEKVFKQVNRVQPENLVKLDSFLIHVNITEDGYCEAGMPLVNAMNLSRTLMRTYGTKPSYLIISVDKNCRTSEFERDIAQNMFYSIYYMRMTGIMGMIYYDYFPKDAGVSSEIGCPECVWNKENLLRLTNYYVDFDSNNREPLLFDNDAYNISKVCDVTSPLKTFTINMSEIDKIKITRLDPNKIKASDGTNTGWYPYVLAIPIIDYGAWSRVSKPEDYDDDFSYSENFKCNDHYPETHLNAERCGVSNFLTLAFERVSLRGSHYKGNYIFFSCENWYSMIDDFISQGKISVEQVQNMDSSTMRKLAFAYAMPEEERDILNDFQMQQYCYPPTSEDNPVYGNPVPCEVIAQYVYIRNQFVNKNCRVQEIGIYEDFFSTPTN